MHPQRIAPGPGQESVWDYPRPPRVELTARSIRVVFNGVIIAGTRRARRVLETSHPPVYYFPPEDVRLEFFSTIARSSVCQFKGQASYYTIVVGDRRAEAAAWYYPRPTAPYAELAGAIAFYASRVDACFVGEMQAVAQAGDFYGGWITPDIVGPFKGEPGTWSW